MTIKKFFIVFCFIILIGFAFAQPPSLPKTPETGSEETTYATVQLYKGWNLVKNAADVPLTGTLSNVCAQQQSVTGTPQFGQDIIVKYLYDAITKNYVKENSPEWFTFLDSYREIFDISPLWVKANRDCIFTIDTHFSILDLQLLKGWNFVVISEDILGKNLSTITGSCSILASYYFDAQSQTWEYLDPNTVIVDPSMIGQGLVVKVSNSCSFEDTGEELTGTSKVVIRVYNELDKKPIKGATVQFFEPGTVDTLVTSYETNDSGKVEAAFENSVKRVYFTVGAEKHDTETSEIFLLAPQSIKNFDIVLPYLYRGHTAKGEPYLGGKGALIDLHLYEDYLSDQSKNAKLFIDRMLDKYGELIRIVHKDFPVSRTEAKTFQLFGKRHGTPSLQGINFLVAKAARCADEQSKFWEYRDILYNELKTYVRTEKGENILERKIDPAYERLLPVNKERLLNFAIKTKLNSKQFEECLNSGRYDDVVQADFREGLEKGVFETPTLFINGQILSGDFELIELMEQTLDPLVETTIYGASPRVVPEYPSVRRIFESSRARNVFTSPFLKVTMLLFCDPLSPECRQYKVIIDRILNHYKNTCYSTKVQYLKADEIRCLDAIRVIYKFVPDVDNYLSYKTATAINCAYNQDKFEPYLEKVFANQSKLNVGMLKEFGLDLGLDSRVSLTSRQFSQCLDGDQPKNTVLYDVGLANNLNADDKTVLFINGKRVEGLRSFEEIKEIVDDKIDMEGFIKREKEAFQQKRTAYKPVYQPRRRG